MYSIVGSHLWIRLIFSSSSRGGRARFRRYNSCTHSITKKAYKKLQLGTYNRAHTTLRRHRSTASESINENLQDSTLPKYIPKFK